MSSVRNWLPCCLLSLASSSAFAAHHEIDRHWDVLAEYVYMRRADVGPRKLVKNSRDLHCDHGCPTTIVLDAKKMVNDFGFESGGRVGLSYRQDTKSIYESRFMYIAPWTSTKEVHGDNSLSFPFHKRTFTEDYNTADKARAHYWSQFYTFDLNYWRNSARRGRDYFVMSGVFGLRFFEIKERFTLAFFNSTVLGNSKSNYNTHARNDAIGIQGGFNLQVNPYKKFTFDALALGGLGFNRAHAKVLLRDQNNTVIIRDYEKQHSQNIVFADAEAKIGYTFVPCMNLHIGYQMFYASGLALAPSQYSFSTNLEVERFNKKDYVIIHGLLVGFNFYF